ncbi:MAG: hypothetical protein CVV50_01995 [Spirochaetae bacterium HGW-Spirochaetae-6]|jgi:hypothetical protein|nr:MAG: hypothetical protein CVV50_01995 [Spirochaetae bacterium HGW-Spirochaetae-6]
MRKIIPFLVVFFIMGLSSCGPQEKANEKNNKIEKNLPVDNDEKGFAGTAIQIKDINENTQLNETGILIVRFQLEKDKENKLDKLPNFRIRGPQNLVIDNSPSNIQKDAIHIFEIPQGKYSISSLYSINKQGEYEFDRPFPDNTFLVESKKINYIGDIVVMLVEEQKSSNLYTRKLKLKLPSSNEETTEIIKDKLKDLMEKYPLVQRIITFK